MFMFTIKVLLLFYNLLIVYYFAFVGVNLMNQDIEMKNAILQIASHEIEDFFLGEDAMINTNIVLDYLRAFDQVPEPKGCSRETALDITGEEDDDEDEDEYMAVRYFIFVSFFSF